jgi:hypothetical protein
MGSSQRRIVAVQMESTRGTFNTGMTAQNSAVPTIRDLKVTPTPIRVDRPTLRLSLTSVADIYTNQASAEVSFLMEVGGVPPNAIGSGAFVAPIWARILRASGFEEVSTLVSPARSPRIYTGITGLTGANALRHGETVNINSVTTPGVGTVVGDFFGEDDVLCIDETTVPVGGFTTITGVTSGAVTAGTEVRANNFQPIAFRLRSDLNAMETISCSAWLDGKRWNLKGCMGNVEFLMIHADAFQARVTLRGVVSGYIDETIPTNANEVHYFPPTFLGKDVRVYEIGASPKGYGRDSGGFANNGGANTVGALNRINMQTGNDVILRENSLDPSGVSFATITDRSPSGSFNPDEVLNTSFDFVSKFVSGAPMRLKAFIGTAAAAGDGNTIDLIAPGIVASSLGDADRDNIHTWDLGFDLTGGDYDSTAAGEAPGNDNEFTIIYR